MKEKVTWPWRHWESLSLNGKFSIIIVIWCNNQLGVEIDRLDMEVFFCNHPNSWKYGEVLQELSNILHCFTNWKSFISLNNWKMGLDVSFRLWWLEVAPFFPPWCFSFAQKTFKIVFSISKLYDIFSSWWSQITFLFLSFPSFCPFSFPSPLFLSIFILKSLVS